MKYQIDVLRKYGQKVICTESVVFLKWLKIPFCERKTEAFSNKVYLSKIKYVERSLIYETMVASLSARGLQNVQGETHARGLTIKSFRKRIWVVGHVRPAVIARLPAVIYSILNYDPGICGISQETWKTVSHSTRISNHVFSHFSLLYVQASPGLYFKLACSSKTWRFETLARMQRIDLLDVMARPMRKTKFAAALFYISSFSPPWPRNIFISLPESALDWFSW